MLEYKVRITLCPKYLKERGTTLESPCTVSLGYGAQSQLMSSHTGPVGEDTCTLT